MSIVNKTPVQAKHVEIQEMGNEYLLYDTKLGQAVYLNDSSALIWTLCDGGRKVEEIIEQLAKEYPDSAEKMESDVVTALGELASKQVISFK